MIIIIRYHYYNNGASMTIIYFTRFGIIYFVSSNTGSSCFATALDGRELRCTDSGREKCRAQPAAAQSTPARVATGSLSGSRSRFCIGCSGAPESDDLIWDVRASP